MERIKIGIVGYGNLGKGVEKAVNDQDDMELAGIYSRRKLEHPLAKELPLLHIGEPIDVLILCGGSATDLPLQTPEFAKMYHIIDSFDHHQQIEMHYRHVDAAARAGSKLALVSCGWDPGLFSMMRTLFEVLLPDGKTYTFWGKGISQGHSDAIRRIKGVKDARQYTIPLESAMEKAMHDCESRDKMDATDMHRRECYVVPEDGTDLKRIEREIRELPDYFAGYDTSVHFISQEKLDAEHGRFPHGGRVVGIGGEMLSRATVSFQLELASNPDFTARILVAYARAVYRLAEEGETGCRTIMQIPLYKLCGDMFMHM